MDELFTDTKHVVESLRTVAEAADITDEGRLTVLDAGQAKVVAATQEEIADRNLWGTEIKRIDDIVCYLDWNYQRFGGLFVDLKFHEKVVEEPFELRPAGPEAIAPNQAVEPTALGEKLRVALAGLVEECGASFTFCGVQAASKAWGGHLTDFEFEYTVDGVTV